MHEQATQTRAVRDWAITAGVLVGLVLLAAVGRLVPHPPNFAPVAACALFAGFFFRDVRLALAAPLLAAMVTDQFALGTYPWRVMVVVYAALLFPVALRWFVRRAPGALRRWGALRVGGAAVASSLVFFLATNAAHWAFMGMYGEGLSGLAASYAAGLPFLKYTLAGDLFYSGVLFGAYAVAQRLADRPSAAAAVASEA